MLMESRRNVNNGLAEATITYVPFPLCSGSKVALSVLHVSRSFISSSQ